MKLQEIIIVIALGFLGYTLGLYYNSQDDLQKANNLLIAERDSYTVKIRRLTSEKISLEERLIIREKELKEFVCPECKEYFATWVKGDCNNEVNEINQLYVDLADKDDAYERVQRSFTEVIKKCKPTCSYLNNIKF